MKCSSCSADLAPGSAFCHVCGRPVPSTSPGAPASLGLEHLVAQAARSARDLAQAAAELSQRAAVKAERAARDPEGSGRRALQRLQEELEKVRQDLDRAFRQL